MKFHNTNLACLNYGTSNLCIIYKYLLYILSVSLQFLLYLFYFVIYKHLSEDF